MVECPSKIKERATVVEEQELALAWRQINNSCCWQRPHQLARICVTLLASALISATEYTAIEDVCSAIKEIDREKRETLVK